MKYLPLTTLALFFLFATVSCEKEDDDDDNNNNSSAAAIEAVNNTVTDGSWRVTRYEDSGTDELYHFSDYTFTFGTDGSISATNGTDTYSGTWSVTGDDSNDDSPDDDLDFIINFNATNVFLELNDDWDIQSRSATTIALYDVSGGDGTTDYLTFTKN